MTDGLVVEQVWTTAQSATNISIVSSISLTEMGGVLTVPYS